MFGISIITQFLIFVNTFDKKAPREIPLELSSVIHLIFKSEVICDHGDELAIRGLAAVILYRVAEVGVERIHVSAIPRDLDRVADGSLYAARGGLVLLCDAGVEDLRDAIDDIAVLYGQEYRGAEILFVPLPF